MSLHKKLTLFFTLPLVAILVVAGFTVRRVVVGEIRERAELSLGPALNATVVLHNDRAEAIYYRVRTAVDSPRLARLLERGSPDALDDFLQTRLSEVTGIDFLIVLDADGDLLGYGRKPGSFVPGFEPPGPDEIVDANSGTNAAFNRTQEIRVEVDGETAGRVIGGFWIDGDLLAGSARANVELSLVSNGAVIASTEPIDRPLPIDLDFDSVFEADISELSLAEARSLSTDSSEPNLALVGSTPLAPINSRASVILTSMMVILGIAIGITTVLAYVLARLITQPLEALSQGARAIAEGRFEHRIDIRSKDEAGQLAGTFNEMSDKLQRTINELSDSRDQLQRTVRRIGETLRSTHDIPSLLDATLHTALEATEADAASFWSFTPTREDLYPIMGFGTEVDELQRIRVGEGVIGLVGERGITLMLPDPSGGPRASRGEPDFPVIMALPIYSSDRIYGVMALYRSSAERPFSPKDLDSVQFLTEQVGVAVENVALHEETNRLSLTDGLTGIYNRRYMQMQFRQVLATAIRFDREFAVLMLDLDFFKQINDNYGHQRGDAILIEFAQRVHRNLREVDTFARYGGEEFICLLSETNVYGAVTTAEKILESVRAELFGTSGEVPIELTVSIGVAAYPEHGDSYRALVEAADQALYKAKKEGRDRVCVAGEEPPPSLRVAN